VGNLLAGEAKEPANGTAASGENFQFPSSLINRSAPFAGLKAG
jgi:hypothetical protein